MKRNIALCFIVLLTAAVSCKPAPAAADVQVGPYTVTAILDSVYHIQDCNDANPSGETFDEMGNKTHFNNCSDMYLIVGEKKALLIDLSNYIRWADDAVASLRSIVSERIGDRKLVITFTHNHGDHTGMLPAYLDDPDVCFALPSVDFEALADRFPADRSCFFEEGYEFDLGGVRIASLMVPGHTAGSMVFFLEGSDILFAGDAIGSGHGVWIFNLEAFRSYVDGVNHLVDYIENPVNGIDTGKLKIYGGHYWQKDWFPELGDNVFGIQYIYDMKQLIGQIASGNAKSEPSNLENNPLDTYFRNGQAIIAWNAASAEEYRNRMP